MDTVRRLVDVGIPVMGHLGLQPQSVHQIGGFKKQATERSDADELMGDARLLEDAGAFAIVLESIPPDVAAAATRLLSIPTIGIGAGAACTGQVLVWHDVLGLSDGHRPKFVKAYADLKTTVVTALRAYANDVRTGAFPGAEHTYRMPDEERDAFESDEAPARPGRR